MAEQFYTILTNIGKAKIANSSVFNNKINLTKFQVGDGGGGYYNPTEEQTKLKNKVWEGNINSIKIDPNNPNWIVIEVIIPSSQGGFMVREAGILDDENNLIAIGKYPETFKPHMDNGSSKDLFIRMILEISNTQNITLKVDPTVIMATKKDIQILESKFTNIDDRVNKIEENIYKDKIDEIKTDVSLTSLTGCNGGFVQLGDENKAGIYGKTLVNLAKFTTINRNEVYKNWATTPVGFPITGRTITVINNLGRLIICDISENGTWKRGVQCVNNITITLTPTEKLNAIYGSDNQGWTEQNKNDLLKIMVLDGEVKTPPNSYFEGMKHVGEEIVNPDGTKSYRIEILNTTENLLRPFDSDKTRTSVGVVTTYTTNGNVILNGTATGSGGRNNFIDVAPKIFIPKGTWTFSSNYIKGSATKKPYLAITYFNDPDKVLCFTNPDGKTTITSTEDIVGFIGVNVAIGDVYTNYEFNYQLEAGTTKTEYVKYDENKTEILSASPWREWDYQTNDGVKHIYSIESILNGSEGWVGDLQSTNTVMFNYKLPNAIVKTSDNLDLFLDKFRSKNIYSVDEEGAFISGGSARLYIRILKSKLTTLDVAGFKAWLTSNNVNIVYRANTETTENTNKTLISKGFENGYFQCNAGPVQPLVTLRYPTNLIKRIISAEEALENINTQLGGMWKVLLSLADRELRMKSINLLTTESVKDNEQIITMQTITVIKNKINEILNVWR